MPSADVPLVGFGLPVSGAWATPANLVRVARRAEELGCASLWTFQRLLHPVSSDLGPGHHSVLDPVAALSFVASQTARIGLGTATICAPFTAPALLAKAMASLDVLSHGRVTVGLGMGWLPEEHMTVGVAMAQRGERFEEYLRCLQALWTDDPVEFHGDHYTIPRSHVGPHVVQLPHPPILLGGAAESALRRAGRLAHGWIASSTTDPSRIGPSIDAVRDGAREAGRDPDGLRILARVVPGGEGLGQRFAGSIAEIRHELEALRAQGITEICVDPNLVSSIGGLDADPAASVERVEAMMEHVVAAAFT